MEVKIVKFGSSSSKHKVMIAIDEGNYNYAKKEGINLSETMNELLNSARKGKE